MGKACSSWSGMRNYLEKEMLADALQGRIRYGCTRYVGMDTCHIFEVYVDGIPFKQFSWETVNRYFFHQGYVPEHHPMSIGEYWRHFPGLLAQHPLDTRTEYTDDEFCDALNTYRNSSIRDSVRSRNPIVKMFALLDRRVGQRTLESLAMEMQTAPDWLVRLYQLRLKPSKGFWK